MSICMVLTDFIKFSEVQSGSTSFCLLGPVWLYQVISGSVRLNLVLEGFVPLCLILSGSIKFCLVQSGSI